MEKDVPRHEMGGQVLGEAACAGRGGQGARLGGREIDLSVGVDHCCAVEDQARREDVEGSEGQVQPDRRDVPPGAGLEPDGGFLAPDDGPVAVELGLCAAELSAGYRPAPCRSLDGGCTSPVELMWPRDVSPFMLEFSKLFAASMSNWMSNWTSGVCPRGSRS
nr:hypothetical protein [Streptomyces viridochromogenes]